MQNFTAYEFIGHTFSKTYSKVSSFKSCLFLTIVKCIINQYPKHPSTTIPTLTLWGLDFMRKWSTDFANPEVGNGVCSRLWSVSWGSCFFSHLSEVILRKGVFFYIVILLTQFSADEGSWTCTGRSYSYRWIWVRSRSWSRSIMTDFLANDI